MKCVKCVEGKYIISIPYAEAALQRCSHEKMPPPQKKKNAANPQENTHTEVWPQQSCHAALLKSHSNTSASPQMHRTNPQKHPPTRAPPKDYIRIFKNTN